jgi:phosphoglycerate dehydrogenase-like enzyme
MNNSAQCQSAPAKSQTTPCPALLLADNVSFYDGDIVDYVYGAQRIAHLGSLCRLHPERLTLADFRQRREALRDTEVIFSCWGMPQLSAEDLDALPSLRAVFYAGGSVRHFAGPLLERSIVVCNAAEANSVPVAEFCLAQILLSCKGAYRNSQTCRLGTWQQSAMSVGHGVYGETVALLGIGSISRHLLRLLEPFHLHIIAVSNYLGDEEAQDLGIDRLVDIPTAFREAYVVSNHLADHPGNRGVLGRELFASMRAGATFINTGRGAQVDEAALVSVLGARPDLTALLDVQHPEPPDAESPLFGLPNVHLTSHIAGSANDEVRRMADSMIDEFQRWRSGSPLEFRVDPAEFVLRA